MRPHTIASFLNGIEEEGERREMPEACVAHGSPQTVKVSARTHLSPVTRAQAFVPFDIFGTIRHARLCQL